MRWDKGRLFMLHEGIYDSAHDEYLAAACKPTATAAELPWLLD